MPVDLNKLGQEKERIISFIKLKGPSLPVHIAKAANLSPLFASAFLSELYSERKLFMSHMKIGSSQLYIIPGQEPQLENFSQYLNQKEREAFELLKNNKILDDDKQVPAIRVALRAIKDFAVPLKIKLNDSEKTIWRYFLVSEDEVKLLLNPKVEQKIEEPRVDKIEEIKAKLEEIKETPSQINPIIQEKENTIELKPEVKAKTKRKVKKVDDKFSNNIKEYLTSKDIEILTLLSEKPKEIIAKIRTDSSFGKQEYILYAKDKKKITSEDIAIAHQKAQSEKTLAIIMSPGEIDKKSLDHYKDWKNLVKFEKIKL